MITFTKNDEQEESYYQKQELLAALMSSYHIAKKLHDKTSCSCNPEQTGITVMIICKCGYLERQKLLAKSFAVIQKYNTEAVAENLNK